MAKKQMLFKTKGMNRDLSVSAFNPEFAFENMNLRLSTNEGNTMMSWVNERGTAQLGLNKEDHHWYKDGKEDVEGEKTSEIARTLELCADIDDAIANDWIWTEPEEEIPGTWSKDDVVYEVNEGETQESVAEILPKYLTVAEAEASGWGWSKYSNTSIEGVPVGTAVLNHKLVLFTTEGTADDDHIYIIEYINDGKTQLLVTEKYGQNIGLDENHPLETLVSYESEKIQKVYWVDGKNQPRVINITSENISDKPTTFFDFIPTLKLQEEVTVQKLLAGNGTFAPGVIQYAFTYYRKNGQESNIFYTTPLYYISHRDRGASPEDKVDNAFKITIKNVDKNFDYLRIYSIQRTSINGTPICKRIQDVYLDDSYDTKGEENYAYSDTSPTVTKNGAVIGPSITGVTRNILGQDVPCIGYNYDSDIEVHTGNKEISFGNSATSNSILWVTTNNITYDGVTAFFIVESPNSDDSGQTEPIIMSREPLSYTDNGTSGESIDPMELLYKGGETIIASTLEQKDGTLFLGNIRNARENLNDLKDKISRVVTVSSEDSQNQPYVRQIRSTLVSTSPYPYSNQLTSLNAAGTSSVPCGGFKRGDYYRCGIQFQHENGKWSDPLFKGDYEVKGSPSINDNIVTLPVLKGSITNTDNILTKLVGLGYRKIRPVIVFPEIKDRVTLCQGVVAPTVYTQSQRGVEGDSNTSSLHAQSSWFFRFPLAASASQIKSNGTVAPYYTTDPENNLIPYTDSSDTYNPTNIRSVEIQGCFDSKNKFRVDNKFMSFHSPDIEFDTQLLNTSLSGINGKYVGKITCSKTLSDINIQTESPTISTKSGGFDHKAFATDDTYGIVSGLFYEDFAVDDAGDDDKNLVAWEEEQSAYRWMVYAWNKEGSLNNDINRPSDRGTATAILKKKIISNLRIADTDWNWQGSSAVGILNTPEIYSGEEPTIVKVGNKIYQGNIDTMLVPQKADGMYFAFPYIRKGKLWTSIYPYPGAEGDSSFTENHYWRTYSTDPDESKDQGIQYWKTWDGNDPESPISPSDYRWTLANGSIGTSYVDLVMKKQNVRMKYKSTPHIVFDTNDAVSLGAYQLPIVELQRLSNPSMFGGTSTDALKENTWVPCGEPVSICDNEKNAYTSVEFEYSYGDTYFQRWDCLKTYAFTKEDPNQIVEIGSFMLETHTNIDGRYDRNRGQVNNLNMSPTNFNLINSVYSQRDNFFSYKIQDEDYYKEKEYHNQITWSKTKSSGADIDLWTNITLASTLELDGDKGEINKLIRFNNYLFAFQDTGIAQILYNDNVQIQSTQGVPIEIANSGKVSGKDYKSSSIGCSNKWSMVTTPNGIYFMDSNDKSIYLFNGQLTNISNIGGFNSWCKQNIPSANAKWTSVPYEENQQGINIGGFENFVGYYDKLNQDILYINNKTALAWSEKLQTFTSFYDYGNTPFFVNLDDTGVWINKDLVNQSWHLWRHQAGNYCKFFGKNKPYWMTLVGNPEPQLDKVFTNLEFRATQTMNDPGDLGLVPFNYIETWNDYQHGKADIDIRSGHDLFKHHPITDGDYDASLIRKFRIWRCDIPRDNAPLDFNGDLKMGISRTGRHPMDRMRNPWLYLKLYHEEAGTKYFLRKTEIHDIVMTYFD